MSEYTDKEVGARISRVMHIRGIDAANLCAKVNNATEIKAEQVHLPEMLDLANGRVAITLARLELIAHSLGTTPKSLMKGIWW